MTSGRRYWWLAGAVLGAAFVVVNLVNLVFVGGDAGRDLIGFLLGSVMVLVATARFLGWREASA